MEYDIAKIRADFPILSEKVNGKKLIYLDNAATSQTPRQVVEAINKAYFTRKANVHRGVHCLSQKATAAMENGREAARRFVNASSSKEIIFTSGATEAINLVASSYGQLLPEDSEIILTIMEHHSNIVPWQLLAQKKNIKIKVVPILPDGSLDMDCFKNLFSSKTKMVSVCHVSNVLGTVNPVKEICSIAHNNGAKVLIDGAQAVPHFKVDVQDIDADFYVFSSHKMYGPTGIGILYGKENLLEIMPPYQGGGEMIGHVSFQGTTWADLPYKFEAGTPDFVGASAIAEAIEYLEKTDLSKIHVHEQDLLQYATNKIATIPDIRIFGTAQGKDAVISFLIGNAHHYDTGVLLDQLGIAVRTGHHCAQPLMEFLGIEGTVRASFAMYNTIEEIDTFINALNRVAAMLS